MKTVARMASEQSYSKPKRSQPRLLKKSRSSTWDLATSTCKFSRTRTMATSTNLCKSQFVELTNGCSATTGGGGGSRPSFERKTTILSDHINASNQEKSLCMRGLPFRVKMEEIVSFFEGYGNVTSDNIFIEENDGRRTGAGCVVFENSDIAQEAKGALNKQEIGGRWIQLFDDQDDFMINLCGLSA